MENQSLFIRKDVILSIKTCRVTERNQSLGVAWSEDDYRAEGRLGDLKGSGCRRRQWHPTPVLLPGKPHGWRSLVGCSPWGC